MDRRQRLIKESLSDAYDCLERDPGYHRAGIVALLETLGSALERIHELERDQDTDVDTRGDRSRRTKALKTELREAHLKRIARRARVILHGHPGIKDLLRVPHESASLDEHLKSAQRIFDTVRPHAADLVGTKLPPDFLQRGEKVAAMLHHYQSTPANGDAIRARATAELPDALRHGREIVGALDIEIEVELADDGPLIARWKHASRVGKRRGRKPQRKSTARKSAASSTAPMRREAADSASVSSPEVTT